MRLFIGALTVAGWLGGSVLAQDAASPPTTQPAFPEARSSQNDALENGRRAAPMSLRNLSLELGFEASYDERSVRARSAAFPLPRTRQVNQSRRFEETLGLQASGDIGGGDLVLFDVGVEAGLSQEWYSELGLSPNRDHHSHGDLLEYDLHLTALPRGKISADGYAQRVDSRVPRMFLPSLDRTLERYGGDVLFNDSKFPMRLSFEHVDEELTGRAGSLTDDEKRGQDTFRYEGTWQASRNQSLRLEYEYADRQEQYSGSPTRFNTRRNYLALNHLWRFGKDERSSWENLIRWQDETGDLGRDNLELSSRLRLQHTDKLATNYAVQHWRDGFQRLETETNRAEVGANYQFDPALSVSLQGYGLEQRADHGADYCEWGSLANLAYAKDNDLGRLSANLSYNHTSTESRRGDHRGIVIGEAVTMIDPLPLFLVHTDIDLLSIIVTDSTRTRTYLPGRDYLTARVGRYTSIQRLFLGAIANRQTVLVSYTYKVQDNYGVQRDRLDLRIQQDFKFGLSPYYAASLQNESLDQERFLSSRERDINRHRLGATFRRHRWSMGLEYEYNDDTIDPYQALHGNGDVILLQTAAHQFDAKLTTSHFWFDGAYDLASHDTTLVDAGVTYRSLLARDLEANAAAMYRFENDSLYGVTHGVDLTAAVDWRIGYFTLRFEAEYDMVRLPGSEDGSFGFWIKLRREIPVVGGKT